MDKLYTTTLTSKELEIIEKLIARHGNVVDFIMIYNEFKKERSNQEVKNFVSKLVKKGWLIKIKKGVFAISSIASRGVIELNQLTIAQIINANSYVSFEAGLQHYGLFDQYLRVIASVGIKKTYNKKFADWTFKYIKTKKGLFFGFKEFNIDGRLIKIATKEKIIIDFLVYKRTVNNIDLIIEKLKNYKDEFDSNQLIKLSQNCSISVKRTLGIIFDLVGINSEKLYELVKKNRNHSFMTSKSNIFNAKWRIYIDKYFKNYK
ncbi:hypothetical protein CVV26_03460 [Candidatus Kuenenbacteria bacterium HGW-Kuenenbacteria-1]|uniref:AbiEi antitoxin C-terminal domain-containing protein n=1 Tax=Candidatus Kuenenbacteria bacterium HGW-Kuenenbacteria-1 TaxID=2013812 RepID=A0A2N1UMM7_9BACT|nr:MAG: hypothetical protein CVV26_03460 [Candidatus Kuenenbacteria bacterium HGW-Kuenenbacteria-1]